MIDDLRCMISQMLRIINHTSYILHHTWFLQFNHFTIFHILAIDHEADDGSHFMPALFAGGAGIHVQAAQFIIIHDL